MKLALMAVSALALAFACGAYAAPSSDASTMVIGGGIAHDCAEAAIQGRSDMNTLRLCTTALEVEPMTRSDEAKTYVNRSVIYLRRNMFSNCAADLDHAEKLRPDLAELHINRGALFIRQHRYQEAIVAIDRGLALNPSEPEKAYYDRGMAHEGLDHIREAYFDYRKAYEINPQWPLAPKAMLRFRVENAPTTAAR